MFSSTPAQDQQLVGAEITFGATRLGHVEGLLRDPLSQRVRRLITSYGSSARRVGVPVEWVVKRSVSRLVLGVGPRSLDDLGDLLMSDQHERTRPERRNHLAGGLNSC